MCESQDPFHLFLQQKAATGQAKDSGEFSLSADRALEKIRLFNFPGPHHWVLAVVQACHASKSKITKIEVFGTRSSVNVRIYGFPEKFPELLQSELVDFQGNQSATSESFRRAFWGSLDQGAIRISQGDQQLLWQNSELKLEELKENETTEGLTWTLELPEFKSSFWHRLTETPRALSLLKLTELLRERAYRSSIPIVLEGRELQKSPPSTGHSVYCPLYLVEGNRGLKLGRLVMQPWGRGRLEASLPLYKFEHTHHRFTFSYLAHLNKSSYSKELHIESTRSSLKVVKHGVIVHDHKATRKTSLSCELIVEMDDVDTDITGLAAQVQGVKETLSQLAPSRRNKDGYWQRAADKFWVDSRKAILQKPQLLDTLDKMLGMRLCHNLMDSLGKAEGITLPETC